MTHLRTRPDLLAKFREGNHEALTEVYTVYSPRIDALLRRGFLGGSAGARVTAAASPADHADAVQEVFVRAFRPEALLAYRGERDYWLYLSSIARNVLADIHRRRVRELPLPTRDSSDDTDMLAELAPAEGEDVPAHGWLEPKAREIAQKYVASLTGPMRAVHDARYVHGLPQREAGEQLGMSRPKLRKLEERMHDQLRALLEQAGIRDSSVAQILERTSHG